MQSGSTIKKIEGAIEAAAVINVDVSQPDYLFLPDLPKDAEPQAEYLVCMPPMNSSGDIYHMLAYLLLAESQGKKTPRVMLAYDGDAKIQTKESGMNSYTQVHRSLAFSSILGMSHHFMRPVGLDTGKCQRENNRSSVLTQHIQELLPYANYLDQKALTLLIAYHFVCYGRETTVASLRKGFMRRDEEVFPPEINTAIVQGVKAEIKKITDHAGVQPLLILHFRYSSHTNSSQNIADTSLVNQLQEYLQSKGYKTWCIFADGRIKHASFKGVLNNRTNPFPYMVKNSKTKKSEDHGKIFHAQFLHDLAALPNIKGVIGNTSGTLDLAAFLGHRVYNMHKFHGAIKYQDYRILIQSAFFSIEFVREELLANAARTKEGKNGSLTNDIVSEHLPNLLPWLNQGKDEKCLLPKTKEPLELGAVDITKNGFSDIFFVNTWMKEADRGRKSEMLLPCAGEVIDELHARLAT